MHGSRVSRTAIEFLRAEVAAAPLVAEVALRGGLVGLSPDLGRAPMAPLWRATERHLLSHSADLSVDELDAVRDEIWFPEGAARPVPLGSYLRHLARRLVAFDPDGDPPDGPGHACHFRRALRWLIFALPADLVLGQARGLATLHTLSPLLERRLADRGFAEPHLHLGAALSFPHLWICAMREQARPDFSPRAYSSPGAALYEGRELAPWLLRAFLARYLLAAFLFERLDRGRRGDFEDVLESDLRPRIKRRLGHGADRLLIRALGELLRGRFKESDPRSYAPLRELYARLTRLSTAPEPTCLLDLVRSDPIYPFFPPPLPASQSLDPTPEVAWMKAGLRYLDLAPDDLAFARLFWQVVRLRCQLYRHVVQRPLTPGLQWFIRTYRRLAAPRGDLGLETLLESAARTSGHGHGLRSLEVRLSPWGGTSRLLATIDRLNNGLWALDEPRRDRCQEPTARRLEPEIPSSPPFELGVVLHLSRDRGGGADLGLATPYAADTHANPDPRGNNPAGYRYATFYNRLRLDALSVGSLFLHFPLTLGIVRGIDTCTDELGIPLWVVAPLFRYIRAASHAVLGEVHAALGARPTLCRTAHTGEDFVHLIGGLRRIEESIRRLALDEGDRLGHASALGVDPAQWCASRRQVATTHEERLLDLAWEWRLYARGRLAAVAGRRAFVEHEICRLAGEIFLGDDGVTPLQVTRLVDDLYREEALRAAGFPNGPVPAGSRESLLLRYLTDPGVFLRGRRTLWVDVQAENETVCQLQRFLRQDVASVGRTGLTVEVNPTSNLLIGNLADLEHHPFWRLFPPVGDPATPPVGICVGSDDPLTFATNLRQEYAELHDALVLGGHSDQQAGHWLDQVRRRGLDARFTLPPQVLRRLRPDRKGETPLRHGRLPGPAPEVRFPP